MVKFTKIALCLLALVTMLSFCVMAEDGVTMYDFKTDILGFSTLNAGDISFDGDNCIFTATATNPVIIMRYDVGQFPMGDYKYLVVRAKSTTNCSVKPYVMLKDKNGTNLYSDIWSGSGAAIPTQTMKTDFATHIFDLTALGSYTEPYISSIQFGIGLYSTGNTCHVDYIAFYTEDALYRTVSFDKNTTDTVTGMPSAEKVMDGEAFTPDASFLPKRDGYYFIGWSTSANGQAVDVIESVTQDTTLYAVWQKDERFSVTYEANAFGQKVVYMPMQRVQKIEGNVVTLPTTNPQRTGLAFVGWSKTADGKNIVTDGFTITEDTTLYAIWSAASAEWDLSKSRPSGYAMASGATEKQIDGGIEYTVTANDPMIYINNVNISTNINKKLHVIAKVTLPEDKTSAALKFYALVDGQKLSEDRTAKVTCTTTTDFVDYVVDFGAKAFWTGGSTCTQLRFDITDNCPGAVITVQKLYFESPENVVYFNANGGVGEMSPALSNESYTLPNCTFTRDGYAFAGYTDGVNTYNVGDSVNVTSPIMLYAMWNSLGGLDSKTEIFYPGYSKKAIVLSYDDGPVQDEILIKKLNAAGMKGAFNLIGGWGYYTEQKKEYYRNLYAGHEIGNHTWSHPNMKETVTTPLTSEECYGSLERQSCSLKNISAFP